MAAPLALIRAPAWTLAAVGLLMALGVFFVTDVNQVGAQSRPDNAVTGLRSTSVSTTSVALAWDAYNPSGPSDRFDKYQVHKRLSGDSWPSDGTVGIETTSTNHTYTGFSPNNTYQFRVRAKECNSDDDCYGGPWSSTLAVTTTARTLSAMSAPTVSATSTDSITISWTARSGASSYRVRFRRSDGTLWTEEWVHSTSKTFAGLNGGESYDFEVAYRHPDATSQSPWSAALTASTETPPPYFTAEFPVINTAKVEPAATQGEITVRLRWSIVEGANGYKVVRRPESETGFSDAPGQVLFDAREYLETTPATGERVSYRVQGVIDGGSGGATVEVGGREITVAANETKYGPFGDPVVLPLSEYGSAAIDLTNSGDPDTVGPGAAPEGITEVARWIAQHTGMGAGAATTLLPLLYLLLAGGAAAVVVLPLGFSPLSLLAGFFVFTLVWSVGGVAWFGLPIAVAALPPVLLAASGVMIFRRRGMFG